MGNSSEINRSGDMRSSGTTDTADDNLQPDSGRREFVRAVTAVSAAAAGGLGLAACGDSAPVVAADNAQQDSATGPEGAAPDADPSVDPGTPLLASAAHFEFLHGVASGDPLTDRVILWSKLTGRADATALPDTVEVNWELSVQSDFLAPSASGTVTAVSANDYIVRIDAAPLTAGTPYYFRFSGDNLVSPVGMTRTLPDCDPGAVRLAVFSCSNYPAGYFNVYRHAAESGDFDYAVHLGDYIYEYGRNGYASERAAEFGREVTPATEILTVDDYRRRYAQYRTDPDLQALHAAMPMFAVWDDHELANDAWRGGAENHSEDTEGDFVARRDAALQAWAEWMPVRLEQPQSANRIYRSFNIGNLVSLHMLDTRIAGRDRQLDYADYTTAAGFDAAGFVRDVSNPSRQLLGSEQTTWLQQQMAESSAVWQVLGQQVLMGRMEIPAPVVTQQISIVAYGALLARASQAPETLTATEQAILAQPAIPYNLDAWDGYAAARETVLGAAYSLQKNLVCLAGDTHNAWGSNLADLSGRPVGVEFATPAVTSPGLESIFPDEDPLVFAGGLTGLIDPLVYADTSRRGYLDVTFTRDDVTTDYVFVSTITAQTYTAAVGQTLRAEPGPNGLRLSVVDGSPVA